jgi:hypothetical protein
MYHAGQDLPKARIQYLVQLNCFDKVVNYIQLWKDEKGEFCLQHKDPELLHC